MTRRETKLAVLALLLLVPVPAIGAAAGLVFLKGPVGQAIFAASKLWLVAFPLFWRLAVDRKPISFSKPSNGGFVVAGVLGAVIAAAIFGAYFWFARGWIDAEAMREVITEAGLAKKGRYIAMGFYWILVNSAVEEYVWRWFVFSRCRTIADGLRLPAGVAVVASAVFFTLHHIVALGAQFDWRVTALGSAGVFVGGAAWSWLYLRYESVWPSWACHVIVDIPIFVIGWWLIFE